VLNGPLSEVTKETINGLVQAGIAERRTIEYKEALPPADAEGKHKFLATVSSFANAQGGHIIFGIKDKRENGEPTGIPHEVVGLDALTIGQAKIRLEQWMQTGITPRILPSVEIEQIEMAPEKGPVLVLRVPQSLSAPHAVRDGDWLRFYGRNSGGRYPLDVPAIRLAFTVAGRCPSGYAASGRTDSRGLSPTTRQFGSTRSRGSCSMSRHSHRSLV
jgi:predicted HTH transcriptional regulator